MDTSEFLHVLGLGEMCCFRSILGKDVRNYRGTYRDLEATLKSDSEAGKDIYFTVLPGGTKNEEINLFGWLFADFDAGKNAEGKYKSDGEVMEYKAEVKGRLYGEGNPFKPTILNVTRNGFHSFWKLDVSTDRDLWQPAMDRLIHALHADDKLKSPSSILRLPGYLWIKKMDEKAFGIPPVMCVVDSYDEKSVYSIYDFLKLPAVPKSSKESRGNRRAVESEGVLSPGGFNTKINPNTYRGENHLIAFENEDQVYQAIKSISPKTFVELLNQTDPQHINCPFHDDKNPSAFICTYEETGHAMFICRAKDKCESSGNVINTYSKFKGIGIPKAIEELKVILGIKFEKPTTIDTKEVERLDANLDAIQSLDLYPTLKRRLKHYLSLLVGLHEIAKLVAFEVKGMKPGERVFFASQSRIAIHLKLSREKKNQLSKRLALFVILGLLYKPADDQIPPKLLAESTSGLSRGQNHVNYFQLPDYTPSLLQAADARCKALQEQNVTMMGMSRELVFRTFGEEEANRVYPQEKTKAIQSEFMNEFTWVIHWILDRQGFATEQDCLEAVEGWEAMNKVKLKRCLQEVLDNYGLVRVQMNKALKEKFGYLGKGYPKIIISEAHLMERLRNPGLSMPSESFASDTGTVVA